MLLQEHGACEHLLGDKTRHRPDSLVEVIDCVSLITNEVIETVRRVCVNQAVANPLCSLDTVRNM